MDFIQNKFFTAFFHCIYSYPMRKIKKITSPTNSFSHKYPEDIYMAATIQKTSKYENKQHGSADFPYTVYRSIIPDLMSSYPMHWHEEMEIIYISSGTCVISVNRSYFHVSAGDIIFILPGMLHAIDSDRNKEAEYYNIVFDIRLLGNDRPSDVCFQKYLQPYLNSQTELPVLLRPEHSAYPQIHQPLYALIRHMMEHLHAPARGAELFVKAQLFTLFWLLEPLRNDTHPRLSGSYPHTQIRKMKDLLGYISANYTRPLTIKEAADFCGYSPSYFMRFFKSFTGATFVDYLNTYRLDKACQLLLNTDDSILDISEKVGFDNHSYFIRIFKRQYQITPHQYRKTMHCE